MMMLMMALTKLHATTVAAAVSLVLMFLTGRTAFASAETPLATPIWNIKSFEEWTLYHDKEYATTTELEKRRAIWLQNQEHVEHHNRAYHNGYTLYQKSMHGPFADLDEAEFASLYLMEPQDCSATKHTSSIRLRPLTTTADDSTTSTTGSSNAPLHVDWRTKGILTPVKSQGTCGSCWTFSTSGCLEAHVCLAAKKDCTQWHGLAEEQLVDCAGDFNNHGCQGGLPSQAFEYVKYSGTDMATEDDYPYTAPDDYHNTNKPATCHVPKAGYKAVVAEVFNITQRDEDDLVHAIAEIGPVSVAYQVYADFRLYSHGIYDSYNHTTNTTMCHSGAHDVNHAVVAVGLGTSAVSGVDYYIIRNSWSADWGMEGHFWIKRGENLCGISDCASFPIVPTGDGDDHDENDDEDGHKAAAVMASRVVTATDKTSTTTTVSALRRGRKD